MAVDFEKLSESPHLLDILIQMEDILDSLDVYVFQNWFAGEVVEGPIVRRYWVSMTLRYGRDRMPDPNGAKRLMKHHVRVDYSKIPIEGPKPPEGEQDAEGEEDYCWLVRVSIPRRLIEELNAGQLSWYDDEVDIEDVQDAVDSGMSSDNSSYVDDPEAEV